MGWPGGYPPRAPGATVAFGHGLVAAASFQERLTPRLGHADDQAGVGLALVRGHGHGDALAGLEAAWRPAVIDGVERRRTFQRPVGHLAISVRRPDAQPDVRTF